MPRFAGALILIATLGWSVDGAGQSEGRRRTREQGIKLARIIVNEDSRALRDRVDGCLRGCGTGGAPTPDALGIAQVVEVVAARMSKRATFDTAMTALSPRVGGDGPRLPRRAWTRWLPTTGIEQPEGWITERDGRWASYARNWARFRDSTVASWMAGPTAQAVPGMPIAWGTVEDYFRFKASRDLCRLPCEGCVNIFAGKRGDPSCISDPPRPSAKGPTISAAVAGHGR
jgi:hypothetical protein